MLISSILSHYTHNMIRITKRGRIPHKILPPCLAINVYRLFCPEVHFSNRIVFDLDYSKIISIKMPFIKEIIDSIC